MAIALNHTIIPACEKEAAACQFARLLGLTYEVSANISHRKVNDTLTFLFDDTTRFMSRTRSSTRSSVACRKAVSPTGARRGASTTASSGRASGCLADGAVQRFPQLAEIKRHAHLAHGIARDPTSAR